ncbi:MAG: hypothetical protein ABIN67_12085 [Ferruginibacter sp.]
MELRKEDLPVTLQAFDLLDSKEIFIAEQVVNNQSDVDMFTNRYTGKLIKAKKTAVSETKNSYGTTGVQKKKSSTNVVMVIILLILVALIIYGFSTGWIQEKLNLKV